MKPFVLLLSFFAFSLGSQAQDKTSSFYATPYKSRNSGSFHKGDNIISVGYGAPNLPGTRYSLPGWYAGSSYSGAGPFYAKYEHGIMDEVGVGLYNATSIFAYQYKWGNTSYTDRGFAISFGLMGYYHFNKFIPVEKLDVYGGVGAAFRLVKYDYAHSVLHDASNIGVFTVAKIGARYYFTESFAAYAEVGHDNMSIANVGVSLRF